MSEQDPSNDVKAGNDLQASAPAANLSKNQLKKLKKQEYRMASKQMKKEANRKRKLSDTDGAADAGDNQRDTNGTTAETDMKGSADVHERESFVVKPPEYLILEKSKNDRKLKEAEEYVARCAGNFSVIIDCDWEDKHSESTLKSLTQQIMFCYGINRRHECPVPLYMTGVGPKVTANLNKSNFHNWNGVTIESCDYLTLPQFSVSASDASITDTANRPKQLVYLTSDAEETLETLEPDCAYIIGGIVDRNRHKFATFNKAKAQNVRVAKLPIKENFALAATHILTVNHVFHILLNYAKYKDWVRAIKEVMPNRKCPVEKEAVVAGSDGVGVAEEVAAEAADEEDNEC